jgi:hypothetical protein
VWLQIFDIPPSNQNALLPNAVVQPGFEYPGHPPFELGPLRADIECKLQLERPE